MRTVFNGTDEIILPDEETLETELNDEDIINGIKEQLKQLDAVLPRAVEDLIAVLKIPEENLPQIMQQRLTQKRDLRLKLKESD